MRQTDTDRQSSANAVAASDSQHAAASDRETHGAVAVLGYVCVVRLRDTAPAFVAFIDVHADMFVSSLNQHAALRQLEHVSRKNQKKYRG